MTPLPQQIRNWPCHRAKLACKIGRDALDRVTPDLPDGVTAEQWALYNVLMALEDIATAIERLETKS
jgi:hypothetical protein